MLHFTPGSAAASLMLAACATVDYGPNFTLTADEVEDLIHPIRCEAAANTGDIHETVVCVITYGPPRCRPVRPADEFETARARCVWRWGSGRRVTRTDAATIYKSTGEDHWTVDRSLYRPGDR